MSEKIFKPTAAQVYKDQPLAEIPLSALGIAGFCIELFDDIHIYSLEGLLLSLDENPVKVLIGLKRHTATSILAGVFRGLLEGGYTDEQKVRNIIRKLYESSDEAVTRKASELNFMVNTYLKLKEASLPAESASKMQPAES